MLAICIVSLAAVPRARAQITYDRAAYTTTGVCNVSPGTVINKQN